MQKLLVITKSTVTRIGLPLSIGVKFPLSPFSSQIQLKWHSTQNTNQQEQKVDNKTNRDANHHIKIHNNGCNQLNDATQYQI